MEAMIKKIIKIKGVGKFKSFSNLNEDIAFNKTTVIFGYNTFGKSTITAIFRSLKESNPHYVQGRKTFGISSNQEIEILDADRKKFVFGSSWENNNIEIFDNDFIAKNVFYGDCINKEQQSSLYEILIGDEVYQLKQSVDKAKQEQDKLQEEKKTAKEMFARSDLGTFDSFLELKEETDIDAKIKDSQDKIKQQENLSVLKTLISNTVLKSTFSNFKVEFLKTLDLSVEESINTHIEKNWRNTESSKDFLSKGLDLLKETGGCVFCGQDLSGVSGFIGDMRKVFSDEYKTFQDSIKTSGNKFIAIDLEKMFLEFDKCGLDLRVHLDYEKLLQAKINIDKKVETKKNDLNLKLDFNNDPDFADFLGELQKLSPIFDAITKQSSDGSVRLATLKEQLKRQELIKYRFSADGVRIFDAYREAEKSVENKKDDIKKLNKKLTIAVNKIFKDNEVRINFFLTELGANFKLKDFSPKSHMGLTTTHFCDYQFVIDDLYVVPVSNKNRKDDKEPENKSYFKNTLSDSDKRVLAFAFFLAKLNNDNDLKSKIIILDDPFSSFDENRKGQIINLLITLKNNNGDEPIQKIILTHDEGFLCQLFKKLPQESKILKIHNSLADGSILDVCDVENDFLKDGYFKDIEYIKNSVETSTNIDDALKRTRSCLEHLLKRKYYFLLKPETLQKKSIGTYLDEIGDVCPKKTEILRDNWHGEMHDGSQILSLNDPAKIEKLKRFLELIKEI